MVVVGGALPALLSGSSPDGAYRLIQAFAGGGREFRGRRLHADRPWLGSNEAHDLLSEGLRALTSMQEQERGTAVRAGAADALAEQQVRGITAWDRATASRALDKLRVTPRRRNAYPPLQLQRELFNET